MERLAQKYGFGILDLLPLLRQHRDLDLFFDHCHPRVKANDLIGRFIADYLKKKI